VTSLHMSFVAVLWLVFAVSGLGKLRGAARLAFAASLRLLGLLPARLVHTVATAVVAGELTVLLGLSGAVAGGFDLVPAVPVVRLGGVAAAAALLCVFTGGITLALRRGTTARCACFGAESRPLSGRHLVRNSILLLVAAGALATPAGPVPPAGALLGDAAGLLLALVLVRLDDLVELVVPIRPARPAHPAKELT
jgi:methylamine utilization protein MauE